MKRRTKNWIRTEGEPLCLYLNISGLSDWEPVHSFSSFLDKCCSEPVTSFWIGFVRRGCRAGNLHYMAGQVGLFRGLLTRGHIFFCVAWDSWKMNIYIYIRDIRDQFQYFWFTFLLFISNCMTKKDNSEFLSICQPVCLRIPFAYLSTNRVLFLCGSQFLVVSTS